MALRGDLPLVSMTKPPTKLSGVPSLSGSIWWQTVQLTPSWAAAALAPWAPRPRLANTLPLPPAALAVTWSMGMWHSEHSSSMAAAAGACSSVSRRTLACQ
jgi:hypothetical protein